MGSCEAEKIIIAHSSVKEYENDGDDEDRYYLPWRAAAESCARLAVGQKVLTVLPSQERFKEFLNFLKEELLSGKSIPVLYTSDTSYLMDTDIRNELLDELSSFCDGSSTIIHPYQSSDEFFKWAEPLKEEKEVMIHSDKKDRNNRWWFGHKGAYHRWIDDPKTPSLSEFLKLPVPDGFVARNTDEAEIALGLLRAKETILKPIFGAGGFQIRFCSSIENLHSYDWPIDPLTNVPMPIAIQERLSIARDSSGERVYSLQFEGSKILGRLTRQRMNGKEWNGNNIPSDVTDDFERRCFETAQRLICAVQPLGDGGIDFADVNGSPIILEVNGGRPTGAHIPKRFKEAFAPKTPHFVFEKIPVGTYSAHEVWELLKSKNGYFNHSSLAYNKEEQTGVFPIVWLKESWGMLASFANTFEAAENQLKQSREALGL